MSRPSYELVLSAVDAAARSSADVASMLDCSEWAAARTLQQLRERGLVELVRDAHAHLVWQRNDEAAVA